MITKRDEKIEKIKLNFTFLCDFKKRVHILKWTSRKWEQNDYHCLRSHNFWQKWRGNVFDHSYERKRLEYSMKINNCDPRNDQKISTID